jgi:hypothetical protein
MLCAVWYCGWNQNPSLSSAASIYDVSSITCYHVDVMVPVQLPSSQLQPSNSRSWHCTADHDIQTGYFLNICLSLLYQQFCLFTYLERWGCALSDIISLRTAPVSASKASMNELHIIALLVIFSASSNHPILILKELKLRSLYRTQCKPVSVWFRARLDIWQNEQDLRSWLL